jgi:hypothetical protein
MSGKVSGGKDGFSEKFVDDKPGDSHLGGTSLVQFEGTLSELGGIIELVPSKVQSAISVVTGEFGQSKGITVDHFGDGKEEEHLHEDNLSVFVVGNGREGLEAIGEGITSGETDSGSGDEVSSDSKHGNTSVLDFDLTVEIELFRVGTFENSQGIPESKL